MIPLLRVLPALALLILPAGARASCGLDLCPIDAAPDAVSQPVQVQSLTRHTAAPGGAAWYVESFLGLDARLLETKAGDLSLGASLPLLWTRDAFGPWMGLGNAIGRVDYRLPLGGEGLSLAMGSQLELPTTTRDTHDDAGHTVVLPYLRGAAVLGPVDLRLEGGWARTLGHSADHEHDATSFLPEVEVNPHSDNELLGRLGLGARLPLGRSSLRAAGTVELIEELGEEGRLVPTAGPSLAADAGPVSVQAQAWFPLSTTARRFDRRLNLVVVYEPRLQR